MTFDNVWFLSDYGLEDEFVGVVKAVVRAIAPRVTVGDVTHSIPAHDIRAGALALARSRLQVSTRVVVPAALSGIVASFVLGVSRAVGETMIVLIAAGGTPNLSFDPSEGMQTMTAFIGAAGLGDQPTGSVGYKTIFAVGSTLFVMTMIMNVFSIRLVRKYREVYE